MGNDRLLPDGDLPVCVAFTDLLNYVSQQIEREEALVNNRITWTLALEGFLFLSSASLLTDNSLGASARRVSVILVALAGIMIAGSTYVGVMAAYASINHFKKRWQEIEARPDLHDKARWFGAPFGSPPQDTFGKLPSLGIPLAIVVGWVGIGVASVLHP